MLNPKRPANACCVIPNFVRIAFTSTCPHVNAVALLRPTPLRIGDRLFETLADAVRCLLMIVASRMCPRATRGSRKLLDPPLKYRAFVLRNAVRRNSGSRELWTNE